MKKASKKEYLLLIVSLILILLILELGFRIFSPKYYKFNDASQEYYINPRGYYNFLYFDEDNDPVYGLNYNTNKKGFRLPNYPLNYSSQPKNKILGLGDSFTFGRGVRYNDIYLIKLDSMLGKDYQILNSGKVGLNIKEISKIFNEEFHKENYSLVIYGFVLNDFGLPDYENYGSNLIDQNNGEYKYNKLRKKFALYNFIMIRIDLKRISKGTITSYKKAFEDDYARDKLELINMMDKTSKSKGGEFILVIFPLLWEFDNYPFSGIHAKLRNYCIDNNIMFIDLLPYFKENHTAEELWAAPTDHHPNEIAHGIAAKAIYNFIQKNKLLK